MVQIGVMAGAVDAGTGRERRVHQHHGGMQLGQAVPDGLGVLAGDGCAGEQAGKQPGAGGGNLVEVECPGRICAEGALRHHREHAGAGRGFEHDVAGPDGGSLKGGVGERQRRRELLQPKLLLGAARLRGLQGGEALQHAEHGGGSLGSGTGLAPHGPSIALEKQHERCFGGLIGILPEPGALGIVRAEGAGHGVPQRGRIEGAASFQDGEQSGSGCQQGGGLREGRSWRGGGVGVRGRGDGGGRTSVYGGRLVGVEHGLGSGHGDG